MPKQTYGPGDTVPASGIYQNVQTGERVTVVQGEPFPPTTRPGQTFQPVVITNPSRKPGR